MAARIYCVTFFIIGLHSVLGAPPQNEHSPSHPKVVETRYCAYYNGSQPCDPHDPTCVPTIQREECRQPLDNDKSNHCFQLWHYNSTSNSSTIQFKGCFIDTVSCIDRSSPCRIHNVKLPLLTCCCEGDMCNANDTLPGSILSQLTELFPPQDKLPIEKIPGSDDEVYNDTKVLELIYNVYLFIHTYL